MVEGQGTESTGGGGVQQVGSVLVLYGDVKAISQQGFERVLQPGDSVFAGDQIITGPDGRISVLLNAGQERLDLGRMTDMVVDGEVYGAVDGDTVDEAVAQVEDIQLALGNQEFDPTLELDDPAAGAQAAGDGGGGRYVWHNEANAQELTPDSGAETTAATSNFIELSPIDSVDIAEDLFVAEVSVDEVVLEETEGDTNGSGDTVIPVISDLIPVSQPDDGEVVEATFGESLQVEEGNHVIEGNLLANDQPGDPPSFITFITIDGEEIPVPADGLVTHLTDLGGELIVQADGTYTYTILTSVIHDNNSGVDPVPVGEQFEYTVTDADGDSSVATFTVSVLDTVPEALPDYNEAYEAGSTGDGPGSQISGNVIFGWDDGAYVSESEDQQSADQGLHVVDVVGGLAEGVRFAFGIELATAEGGSIVFYSDGSYEYSAPGSVENEVGSDGLNSPVTESFEYTVADGDGSVATATLAININDSVPVATNDIASVAEGGRTLEGGENNQISGNVITAENNTVDPSGTVIDNQDLESNDAGLTLVDVHGDFASDVSFALDTELATAQGGQINFSADGGYTYTAPDDIDHEDAIPDSEQFTYTIEDGDGSQASASLSIDILEVSSSSGEELAEALDVLPEMNTAGNESGGTGFQVAEALEGNEPDDEVAENVIAAVPELDLPAPQEESAEQGAGSTDIPEDAELAASQTGEEKAPLPEDSLDEDAGIGSEDTVEIVEESSLLPELAGDDHQVEAVETQDGSDGALAETGENIDTLLPPLEV